MNTLTKEGKGFAVVELFTSEGCSSCPPADKLLEQVQKEYPEDQLHILAYHVDYWDHQGWKDTFSDADYTKRQAAYADWFKLFSMYTPQAVVNGKKELVGSKSQALRHAITESIQEEPARSITVKTIVHNDEVSVDYNTNASIHSSNLVLALTQKSGQNAVKAGENSGLLLRHVQVVRDLVIEPLLSNSGVLQLNLPKAEMDNEWEVIAMIQDKYNGEILAATKSQLTTNTAIL